MASDKLAALALLLALFGCVAHTCQASYGFPYPLNPPRLSIPRPAAPALNYYHYSKTCPEAEDIVRKAVEKAVTANRGIGAGLIRLFFHDCFVQGCDGSVLLDNSTANEPAEKFGIPNKNSLRGFEVIDEAKEELERKCKDTVSCADIVAFAARDAASLLSYEWIKIQMPAGRYDGRVSRQSETLPNLPPPFANVTVLEAMFKAKGLNLDEMVTLSGAHTVGIAHCSSFADRLPPNPSDDPMAMNSKFADSVTSKCKSSSTVDQDYKTPTNLDNQYYQNVLDHKVLFKSDAALNSSNTRKFVEDNLKPYVWKQKFEQAMVKMGSIELKTRKDGGEIRKHCRVINY